jgi:hypothetical protein
MAYKLHSPADSGQPLIPVPDTGPRPDEGPMKDSEFRSIMHELISSAIQYVDGELSADRAEATDFYMGRPFGNEESGRSQVVLTEVRDGVQAVLPPMLRVVFGPEHAVEFRPRSAEDVDAAQQKTDYVRFVFESDNPGFLHTHSVMKDGLIRKIGAFKWWWDDTTATTTHKLENVDQEGLELLAQDDEVELTRIEESGEAAGPPGPDGQPTTIKLHDVELKRTVKDGRARFAAIPPEELIFVRDTRAEDSAIFLGHRTRKTRGELLAMGIDAKIIDAHGSNDSDLPGNEEAIARTPNELMDDEELGGKANDKILCVEGFVRVDFDGDGFAELRRVVTIGAAHHPVENEPWDEPNIAVYCPDPEPHQLVGLSWADRLMDIQKIKSFSLRAGLDSFSASLHPRTWYVEGQANLADILNTAIGAPIRLKSPGAVGELEHHFTGKEAFGVLSYIDEVVERRTGQSKGAVNMDADAMQSSTKSAVQAAITAAQAQQEMLVRIFCEGALKKLFRGLLKLLVKHQPRARVVRLRNQWVTIDPRTWDADMDVTVNVALGAGLTDERIATLERVVEAQMGIAEKMGEDNPICGLKEIRDTLAQIVEMRGFKDSARYFRPITEEQMKQLAEAKKNQPPPKSPEMVLAEAQIQIEQMKAENDKQLKMMDAQTKLMQVKAELELKRREIALEDDRQRDKQAAETIVKLRKIEADTGISQASAIEQIEQARASAMRSPFEVKPRVKRVKNIERDGSGRLVGATVVEEEDLS